MKFYKVVLFGISEESLTDGTWGEIDLLSRERVIVDGSDRSKLLTELADADCLLVDFLAKVDQKVIDAAPNLRYIGLLSSAFDRVDVGYAASKGIPVSNLHGFCQESVAELVIAMLLADLRDLHRQRSRGLDRDFEYTEVGIESRRDLQGLDFGVVGLGSIGHRVAELASAFGCNVSYNSLHEKDTPFRYKKIDDLMSESDIVTLHVPLDKNTHHMLDEDMISKLKPGAVVVVLASMELVDIDALAVRLKVGDIRFITDHAELLAKADIDKLSSFENCIMYPPIGPVTANSRRNKQTIFVENIKAVLSGTPQNRVN